MAVSIRWLVGRPDLGLRTVVGVEALDRDIDYVVTTELADPTPWLTAGAMVLVTGLGLPDTEDELDDYVARLDASGVVAIGFGVGVLRDTIPAGLVGAARRYGFPLVAVPLATPFVAVAKTVSDRAEALRVRAQEVTAQAQPRLTRAAVNGGRSAMLRELARACDGAAILLDPHGRVVDSRPAGVAPDVARAVGTLARGSRSGVHAGTTPAGPAVVHTVRAGERTYGYLAVVTEHEPRAADHLLIGHANSLLTLDFEKPRHVDEVALRVNAVALSLLLSEGTDLEPVVRHAATTADPARRIRVLAALDTPAGAPALAGHLGQRLLASSRPAFVTVARDGAVVVLLRGDDEAKTANALFAGLPVAVRRRLRVGMSGPADVSDAAKAAAAARTAAEAARPGGPPADAADLAGHTLLALPEASAALAELASIYITPLARHDAEHGTALVASLRAYLESHGQWEAAAGSLGVHRHTLRARIAKAGELIGADLDSARVRAELLLAILAHRTA